MQLRQDALQIFAKALQAADAAHAIRQHFVRCGSSLAICGRTFDLENFDRVFVLAVGKAAVPMAQALSSVLDNALTEALIVTKHGHGECKLARCQLLEGSHPVPDEAGAAAAERTREFVRRCGHRDLLLVAISGGASAILPAPAEPLTLADKQRTTELLLKAGANIGQLNSVRKHLSFLKGGRLAALAQPATVIGLLLSDVIGDRLDVIGSGLTAPDTSTFSEALETVNAFGLRDKLPPAVQDLLARGARGALPETPKPGDAVFANVHNFVVGSNRLALEAAAVEATRLGYRVRIVSDALQGEARQVAAEFVALLGQETRPVCLLGGGETTVTVRGAGKGGRSQEFALASASALEERQNALLLSAGTDGTDGPTDAAGAIVAGDTLARARARGMNAEEYLRDNNSYAFFNALDDLVRTGPTGTNVMDVYLLLAH